MDNFEQIRQKRYSCDAISQLPEKWCVIVTVFLAPDEVNFHVNVT
jgi:hypothetical protein